MTRSNAATPHRFAVMRGKFALARSLILLIAALALSACETDGTGPSASGAPTAQTAMAPEPPKEPAKPEPPMTRARAATECWMRTEKDSASVNLDKRADIVTKCIDNKMKAAAAAPKT